MNNKTLGISLGGTTGKEIPFLPIPMYLEDGSQNLTTVAAYATLNDKTVNIENAYLTQDFDFTGTRKFDEKTGYHSQSFLTIPMKNHEEEVIGVLQLINAIDVDTHEIIPFSLANQSLVESLASQAAVAMTNHDLIEGLKGLFEAFIELMAEAIDQKSPYTGGHCRRVPELTMMLAQAAIDTKVGPLKDFTLNEKEFYELKIAGWLHDCGKVTTPESVMDKPTKLSGIFDRIQLVDQRFELLKSQAECTALKNQLAMLRNGQLVDFAKSASELEAFNAKCDADRDFLRKSNFGSESMTPEDQQRVIDIAATQLQDSHGNVSSLLSENEIYNLNIAKG
ncbi:MAG: GAF domain-containing protein, partial [Methylotenera sp.]